MPSPRQAFRSNRGQGLNDSGDGKTTDTVVFPSPVFYMAIRLALLGKLEAQGLIEADSPSVHRARTACRTGPRVAKPSGQ